MGSFPLNVIKIRDLLSNKIYDIEAGKAPIEFLELDNFLYVLGHHSFTVSVIDLNTYMVVRTFHTGKTPVTIQVKDNTIHVDDGIICPVFPVRARFIDQRKKNVLRHFISLSPPVLELGPIEKPTLSVGPYKQLVDDYKDVAMLAKNIILDLLTVEEALVLLILTATDSYLGSTEWTVRRTRILHRLCVRLWHGDYQGSAHLVRLLKTLNPRETLSEFR